MQFTLPVLGVKVGLTDDGEETFLGLEDYMFLRDHASGDSHDSPTQTQVEEDRLFPGEFKAQKELLIIDGEEGKDSTKGAGDEGNEPGSHGGLFLGELIKIGHGILVTRVKSVMEDVGEFIILTELPLSVRGVPSATQGGRGTVVLLKVAEKVEEKEVDKDEWGAKGVDKGHDEEALSQAPDEGGPIDITEKIRTNLAFPVKDKSKNTVFKIPLKVLCEDTIPLSGPWGPWSRGEKGQGGRDGEIKEITMEEGDKVIVLAHDTMGDTVGIEPNGRMSIEDTRHVSTKTKCTRDNEVPIDGLKVLIGDLKEMSVEIVHFQ